MCRHFAYVGAPRSLAALLTEGPRCLVEQSWAPRMQRHGTVNADGFGVGWYVDPDGAEPPARYRRAVPVWADPNLPDLARAVRSHAVLAAVRSATPGTSQDESAAAPYRSGGLLFSHNGAVPDWERLVPDAGERLSPEALLRAEARCDSAVLWALVVRRLERGEPAGDALAAVVCRTAAVRPAARLNLLVTDGRTITATRCGDTLWYRATADGVSVASEPASADDDWREVPDRSLLLATAEGVRVTPLAAAPGAAAPDPRRAGHGGDAPDRAGPDAASPASAR